MSLLDTASLIVTPNGYKAGTLYSVIPNTTLGDLSVTRATTATRVNSSGLIESVASNVPRLDYTNGTCPSILVEPQRTNLFTYSEQFDNVSWNKYQCTVNSNQTISPDGTNTADKLILSGGSGTYTGVTYKSSTANASSIYMKNDNIGTGKFLISVDAVGSCAWNSDGTLNYVTGGSASDGENMGNGWFRFTFLTSSGSGINYGILNGNSSSSIYIWGAQAEAGSYATSYIPTTSASVTRNADVINKTGISSLIGQTEGTIYIDCSVDGLNSFNEAVPISIFPSGGDVNGEQAYIAFLQNGRIRFVYFSNTVNVIDTSIGFWTYGNTYKIAVVYKENDFAMYVNGNLIGTDTSGTVISMSNLYLDYQNYAGKYNINLTALWKTRLTNTQLAQLTTI